MLTFRTEVLGEADPESKAKVEQLQKRLEQALRNLDKSDADAQPGDALEETAKEDEQEAAAERQAEATSEPNQQSYASHRRAVQRLMEERFGDLGGMTEQQIYDMACEVCDIFILLYFGHL